MSTTPTTITRKSTTTTEQVQPKIVVKGTKEFRHDLYKLRVESCQKNTSWTPGDPKLVPVEHTHFFHSHSMRGLPHKYSTEVAGHFHEITTSVDKDGNLTATSGPALRKVYKPGRNNTTQTIIEAVTFTDKEKGLLVDNHKHDTEYVHSEYLSQEKLKTMQQEEAAKLKSMGVGMKYVPSSTPQATADTEVLG